MKLYSTTEVAERVGVNRVTLQRWMADGKVRAPKLQYGVRLWTERDIGRVRRYKQENYHKGRGRKPKRKV
jgi:excisionase family DNA binding protein